MPVTTPSDWNPGLGGRRELDWNNQRSVSFRPSAPSKRFFPARGFRGRYAQQMLVMIELWRSHPAIRRPEVNLPSALQRLLCPHAPVESSRRSGAAKRSALELKPGTSKRQDAGPGTGIPAARPSRTVPDGQSLFRRSARATASPGDFFQIRNTARMPGPRKEHTGTNARHECLPRARMVRPLHAFASRTNFSRIARYVRTAS